MNKKGFTLVELLTVIIILGILIGLIIPNLKPIVLSTRGITSDTAVVMIKEATKNYIVNNNELKPKNIGDVSYVTLKELNLSGYISNKVLKSLDSSLFKESTVIKIYMDSNERLDFSVNIPKQKFSEIKLIGNDEVIVSVNREYQEKSAIVRDESGNDVSITIDKSNLDLSNTGIYYVTYSSSDVILLYRKVKVVVGNSPLLVSGMTPVIYDQTDKSNSNLGIPGWKDVLSDNSLWFLYNSQIDNSSDSNSADGVGLFNEDRWANARLDDGSLYVWIPRFSYKIDQDNKRIDIKYSSKTNDYIENGYKVHPAFCVTNNDDNGDSLFDTSLGDDCFDSDDWNLEGFWVSKYELGNYNNKIVSKPNTISLYKNVYDLFSDVYNLKNNINNFDSNLYDTHMIKNQEWGAISYLSYFIRDNEKVFINNAKRSTDLTTYSCNSIGCAISGCSGETFNENSKYFCNPYFSEIGKKSSTTGNIYGIYDMLGGNFDFVASYLDDSNYFVSNKLMFNSDLDPKYIEKFNKHSISSSLNNFNININNFNGMSISKVNTFGECPINSNNIDISNNYCGWNNGKLKFFNNSNIFAARGGSFDESENVAFSYFVAMNNASKGSTRSIIIKK